MGKKNFYAVARGKKTGIYTSWNECFEQVDGFPNNKYQGFSTREEAEEFMTRHLNYDHTPRKRLRTDGPNGSGDNAASSSSVNRDVIIPVDSSDQGPSVDGVSFPDEGNENAPDPLVYVTIDGEKKSICRLADMKAGQTFKTFSTEEEAKEYMSKDTFLQDLSDDGKHGHVWTDGSRKPYGIEKWEYLSGFGVYWGPDHPHNFSSAPLMPIWSQGINRAELMAVNHAIKGAIEQEMKVVTVHTDSQYVEQCAGAWIGYWLPRNWIKKDGTPVKNKNEVVELFDLMRKIDVRFIHVKAHSGDPNNTAADLLAQRAVDKALREREEKMNIRAAKKVKRERQVSGNSVDSGRSSPSLQPLGNEEEQIPDGETQPEDRGIGTRNDQVAVGAEGTEDGENHDNNGPNQVVGQEMNGNGHSEKDSAGEDVFESDCLGTNLLFGDND